MRRRGRECAVQVLYQMDLNKALESGVDDQDVDEALRHYFTNFESVVDDEREFTERLVRGVVRELNGIDAAIAKVSSHWRVGRMDKVDKSILRLAAFEILHCPDVPRAASINEAIEIAKRFSGRESAGFINGVLDQLARDSNK